eukprot:Protomagalhaensia_sp_Gyna_25__206@NODE_1099_length_2192_cov_5_194148_g869_i0_p4_GENE_NODE_1099_length_2192_cov_5_194148_g869_i0NODE_1099_length_2192_cov_5_194148_g869_i0_p4_ORF_typecomplete_len116_score1_06DUF3328/PF11807_8/0_05_NODE_1099_length_2192_cov_5_194148_g869_i017332080
MYQAATGHRHRDVHRYLHANQLLPTPEVAGDTRPQLPLQITTVTRPVKQSSIQTVRSIFIVTWRRVHQQRRAQISITHQLHCNELLQYTLRIANAQPSPGRNVSLPFHRVARLMC